MYSGRKPRPRMRSRDARLDAACVRPSSRWRTSLQRSSKHARQGPDLWRNGRHRQRNGESAEGARLRSASRGPQPSQAGGGRPGARGDDDRRRRDRSQSLRPRRRGSRGVRTLRGLVYAVGTINLKPLAKLTDADFETDFRINALGAAKAVQAALPALRTGNGGAIVLFSTVAVAQGFAAHASIAMAKGAVEGLTLALAAESAPKVRVNAIAPSLTRTGLAAGVISNETVANGIAQMHALPRLGTADDIGALAAFLISDAFWITGQILGV